MGSIPGLGRTPGGGKANSLGLFLPGESRGQRNLVGYSPWGRKSRTLLSDFHFTRLESRWSRDQKLVVFETVAFLLDIKNQNVMHYF